MVKNYILKTFFYALFFLSLATADGQSNDTFEQKKQSKNIEGLNIFPNPVSNGIVFITTKRNLPKTIEIYDVLGGKIISQKLYGKELKIKELNPGVYILKIKEGKFSATRKLVIKQL